MKVAYTREALRNLGQALDYLAEHFPASLAPFERHLRLIERRLATWPESARRVAGRPGVRVVPMIRYPYRIFYRVSGSTVEILHIHHSSRRDPEHSDA